MTEALGFSLSEISRLMRRRFDARARAIGVTRPQWHTLAMLSRHEGVNQGGLAELMEVEPITACRMIDRLEEAGLVERRRDPNDRRAWRIYLTDAAKPLIERLRAIGNEVTEQALAGIGEDDRERLTALLAAIRTNLVQDDQQETAANG
ncbi:MULTISPECIES: MarR family winged helix-turn-helix transcriptional regulator [unclassified Sphingosinithalassobacter]|uniref:MarR family winged helix-turn-helix transcriptional regulator n=1 Tax=unclassified Sphingosinithalassobacter TaxID=2676235 RepID=UPI00165DB019|nr:MarR family transcriptional regulator [Sphingosinithalassobacter sp. CS137]